MLPDMYAVELSAMWTSSVTWRVFKSESDYGISVWDSHWHQHAW